MLFLVLFPGMMINRASFIQAFCMDLSQLPSSTMSTGYEVEISIDSTTIINKDRLCLINIDRLLLQRM